MRLICTTTALFTSLLALAPIGATGVQAEAPVDVDGALEAALQQVSEAVLFDVRDGVIDARGANWKAHFSPDGARFVPFLGADAPRNFPVGFRLEAASVAGAELPLAGAPTVRRDGDRVLLDHGPILEVYELSAGSIEQSFVVKRRRFRGEVKVRLAVDSELTAATDGRGLRFDGALGGAKYGEAFALDASGRRADVRTTLDADVIELAVPDAFPIDGDGELVIDPVIETMSPITATSAARNADVAFEKDVAGGGVYIVTYETGFSATDRDIYAIEVRAADGAIQNLGAIDISSDDTSAPKVAGNDGANSFLVVYEHRTNGTGWSRIWSRIRIANSSATGNAQRISDNLASTNYLQPDVGGDNRAYPGYWGVVWKRQWFSIENIQARAVGSAGSAAGDALNVSDPILYADGEPTISEGSGYAGAEDCYAFAYSRRNSASDRDVFAGQLSFDFHGAHIVEPAHSLGQLGDFHGPSVSNLTDVSVGAGDTVYAVAVEATGPGSVADAVVVLLCRQGQVMSLNNLSQMEGDPLAEDYASPSVAWMGDGFVFTYSSANFVHMATGHLADRGANKVLTLAERRREIRHNNSHSDGRVPAIASRWESGDAASDEALVAYDSVPAGGAFRTVRVATVRSYDGTPSIGSQYCRTGFNSVQRTGWLTLHGTQSVTGTKIALAQDLPGGQFALLVNSRSSGLTLHPAGSQGNLCLGGSLGRMTDLLTQVLPTGTAFFLVDPTEIQTASGHVAAQPGETWYFQTWYRDTHAGSATSNFTNAVRVELN